jgi:RloB-like protein
MGYKKRGYNRDTPIHLVRDYKLFVIACEGEKREPEYFNVFQYLSKKIKVDVIDNQAKGDDITQKHGSKSAPQWVLDRAMKYIEKNGLQEDDDLWFVIDTDRWTDAQLRALANFCQERSNWHLVISNPCFEIWLYFHYRTSIIDSKLISCNDFKYAISKFEIAGYHPHTFIPKLKDAILNAKVEDADSNHFLPDPKTTKVYQLGEAILKVVGINDFDYFINVILPTLKY